MNILKLVLYITLASCLYWGCNHPPEDALLAHISDPQIKELIKYTCEASGGIVTYQNLDSVHYTKKTILYLSDGSVESEVIQEHRYELHPHTSGSITWSDSLGDHKVYYSQEEAYKMKDGVRLPGSEASAKSTFMSSYYVLFIPYKLMDPGVNLTYEGLDQINDRSVHVLKATYDPKAHDNHSTSDDWYYFIDEEEGYISANLVYHAPTYAYIENIKTTDAHPLRMNEYRRTWRTDKKRNKEYLRGEFWYSDYRFTLID
jgi:hypothetical protein